MTIARRPSPFGELLSLRQAMDRLFEDSFVSPRTWRGQGAEGRILPLDVYVTADELVAEAAIPGVAPENVDITLTGDTLTLACELPEPPEGDGRSVLLQEIARGRFTRTLTLPSGLEPDKASASFENGLLTLRVPKAEQVKPRQIKISPTVGGSAVEGRSTTNGQSQTDRAAVQSGESR